MGRKKIWRQSQDYSSHYLSHYTLVLSADFKIFAFQFVCKYTFQLLQLFVATQVCWFMVHCASLNHSLRLTAAGLVNTRQFYGDLLARWAINFFSKECRHWNFMDNKRYKRKISVFVIQYCSQYSPLNVIHLKGNLFLPSKSFTHFNREVHLGREGGQDTLKREVIKGK